MPLHPSTPSLTSLVKESQRGSSLAREALEQRYRGHQVCWQLVFATAVPLGKTGMHQVLATQRSFGQRFGSTAVFQIKTASDPALLTILPGRRVRVCGAIRAIKADSVTLETENVEVLAKTFFDRYRY